MLCLDRTYTDYDGNKRTEKFYFNLNRAELLEMDSSEAGGMEQMINRIISEQDTGRIMATIKEIILKAYGVKSPDGRMFVKTRPDKTRVRDEFEQTEAFSDLFIELVSDPDKAAGFVDGILPKAEAAPVAGTIKAAQ